MEVKERILEKAGDLFMRYGIRSITMDEIAAQLGISKKTIYQFFTDKDEMVAAVIDLEVQRNESDCVQFRKEAGDAVQQIFLAVESLEEMLQAMNPQILYDLEKHHPRSYKKIRDYKYQFLYKELTDNLQWGIEEGLYRPELNIDILSKSRIEAAFLPFNPDVFPHTRYRITELSVELAMHFLYGVTTLKGRLLVEKYITERNKKSSHEQKA